MKFLTEEKLRSSAILEVARSMLIAARTAPKSRGVDSLVLGLLQQADLKKLAVRMRQIGMKHGMNFFIRDAENVMESTAVVLIGTRIKSIGIKRCGMCGFKNCEEKNQHPDHPCAFNTGDLGIAVGSAVSIAADHRVDNRVMFSVGQAAIELGLLGKDVIIAYGIPLSCSGKSPFFDRAR
jgi:uncharacterized ferredoxin-like protein